MSVRDNPAVPVPQSLRRLRLRLTAWYVGTFFTVLVLLGIGLFATITRRFDGELDASLRDATRELGRVARLRDAGGGQPSKSLLDSIGDVRIPDRLLMVLDTLGRPSSGGASEPWIQDLARGAAASGVARRTHVVRDENILRARAERVTLPSGRQIIAVAAANEIELEDRYASLIAAFGTAALLALVLVAAGGWFLARQSTGPVERVIIQMRRFMADAAHELRTPLTVVRSRAEVALQRPRQLEDYVMALRSIERESERLSRIVEDLLLLARADAGERAINRRRVFLDDITLDAAEAVRVIADRKGVRLEVQEFEEAAVDADPALLRQLVVILLDNAIKFTNAGGTVRVSVSTTPTNAVLAVVDSGIGIEPEKLPYVFDRFFRADSSRTRSGERDQGMSEGVGLGLSIAQWIVDEHGGSIALDSEPGKGTRAVAQFNRASNGQAVSSS